MPRRTGTTTKEYLASIPLPQHGGRYTVIPHKFIIDNALSELAKQGLNVETELYRCSLDGNVASGVYYIQNNQDPELGMMFSWSNSYDKTMKFKCAVGAYVQTSKNLIIKRDMGSYGRKHTGNADSEALLTIVDQIQYASQNFARIVDDKEKMKLITVSREQASDCVGRLFLERELLTTEQLSIIKLQLKKPSFDYLSAADSLWVFYNHISFALQKAHPKTWLDQQRLVNWFLCNRFNIDLVNLAPSVVTNTETGLINNNVLQTEQAPESPYKQITLDESIAEIEAEQVSVEAKGSDFDIDKVSVEQIAEVQDFTAEVDDFNLLGASSNNMMEDFDL